MQKFPHKTHLSTYSTSSNSIPCGGGFPFKLAFPHSTVELDCRKFSEMATLTPLQMSLAKNSPRRCAISASGFSAEAMPFGSRVLSWKMDHQKKNKKMRSLTVVAAVGDVSSDGTTYLIAGAAAVALLGTAFPILFSRKDLCPECDGAGFIRQAGAALRANAARKDQAQIVCPRCNGLGKLNQIDK